MALTSCAGGSPSGSPSSDTDKLSVVATTTQLTDFAHAVAGDDANVLGLLPAGGSAHHFDPSPKDLLELSRADVLIVNGAGLEGFIDSAIEASGFSGVVVTAADGLDLAAAQETTEHDTDSHEHSDHEDPGHEAEDEHGHDAHADEHTDEHDHGSDGHAGHDHGAVNPHLWTSPRNASGMVAEIARGFEQADPDHASDYAQRASDYEAQLAALDEWIRTQFDRVPEVDRVLVSGHDSLSYYLHDYGIRFAGSIMPSFEDNAEPSAAEIDELIATIKREGVKAVFVESSMSPKLARTIAHEAGIAVVDADSLYADSLGAPGSGAEHYIDATVHNTRVILEAWSARADPLPPKLESALAPDPTSTASPSTAGGAA